MQGPSAARPLHLLRDPIIRVEDASGSVKLQSLAELLSTLLTSHAPVLRFPGLAAEQSSHWYRFLVRCASKVLRTCAVEVDPRKPDLPNAPTTGTIHDTLQRLTGTEEAWLLHSEDSSQPAFLQPPLKGATGTPEEAGYDSRTVSILTALIGSKNFERKSEAVRKLEADELVFSLVEFQGGVIFGGRGNYETQLTPSRSGKGSGVPFMGIRLPGGLGATFRHDVWASLGFEERIRRELKVDGDVWALWVLPWDATTSMPSNRLDPFFIPLARLVRVGQPDSEGRFTTVWFKASNGSRVDDLSGGALLGDIFTPTIPSPKKDKGRKVRGVMEGGFNYPEVADLLGVGERDARPSVSVEAFIRTPDSEVKAGVHVLLEGLAYEQGKTLGWYRRLIPLPAQSRTLFGKPEPVRQTHGFMLQQIAEGKRILRAAARIVLSGEPRPRTGDEMIANIPAARLDDFAEYEDHYLDKLFEYGVRAGDGDESWQQEWMEWIQDHVRVAFESELPKLVTPVAQRPQREAEAFNYLDAKLRIFRPGPAPGVDPSAPTIEPGGVR